MSLKFVRCICIAPALYLEVYFLLGTQLSGAGISALGLGKATLSELSEPLGELSEPSGEGK